MSIDLGTIDSRHVWRFKRSESRRRGLKTGWRELDRRLPDGGWREACLTEIITAAPGTGELELLTPALASLSQQHRIALISPPLLPYAPALANCGVNLDRLHLIMPDCEDDGLWAAEQVMRSGSCRAVVVFQQRLLDPRPIRRLQLAAEAGNCMSVLVEYGSITHSRATAAAFRLLISPTPNGRMQIEITKARGGLPVAPFDLIDATADPEHPAFPDQLHLWS